MNVKVADLMVPNVVTTTPHKTVGHVKAMMRNSNIRVLPVVGPEDEPLGIISASDLLDDLSDETPVSRVMTEKVYTVAQYDDVHVPARVMRNHRIHHVLVTHESRRNHRIHHVLVTHESRVVGILSSFDLIQLVEDKRFVMKNPPTESSRRKKRRE
jgi:CBS domain-containing protein